MAGLNAFLSLSILWNCRCVCLNRKGKPCQWLSKCDERRMFLLKSVLLLVLLQIPDDSWNTHLKMQTGSISGWRLWSGACSGRSISWWSRVWIIEWTTVGLGAMRQPCGLLSCWNHAADMLISHLCWRDLLMGEPHARPKKKKKITRTWDCHLLGACLAHLCPQTELVNPQERSSCRLAVSPLAAETPLIYRSGYGCFFQVHHVISLPNQQCAESADTSALRLRAPSDALDGPALEN